MVTATHQNPADQLQAPATQAEKAAEPRPVQVRRNLSSTRLTDVLSLVGAMAAAVSTTWLLVLFTAITGPLAPVVIAYGLFIVFYAALVSMDENSQVVRSRVAAALVVSVLVLTLTVLALVVIYCFARGYKAMLHANFYTEDMTRAGPIDPLTIGGIQHAIVGTLEQIAIGLAITIPLGITCAVYLNEFPGRPARLVRTLAEAMTALPSVVAGLFIYATWIIALGRDKSGLAAALALSVMMLPIIIRAADVVLRLVPGNLKEASYALGSSHWRTVWHVVLPTSRSGLTTAVILGTARGIGETSPVLLTAGFTASLNLDPASGPMVSLPLQAFSAVGKGTPEMLARGFGTAAFLLCLVLTLFVIARILGGRAPGVQTRRQARRTARRSKADARRFAARTGALVVVLGLAGLLLVKPVPPALAADYVPISGSGSTWSQNALDQWRRNVTQYGMQINYAGTGSSDGRNQFRLGTVDFAVSEIPYGLTDGGRLDAPPSRKFAYMPIVAGGTAFMYNLKINGQRVTNLRLSGENLAKIFTGNITTWNDAAIRKDNPGLALPPRRIVPVVRSDGSGTTAQLTTWMSHQYASIWNNYCKAADPQRPIPCGVTSQYPVRSGSGFTAQSGSLGVSGYVSQVQNEGTITYVEYSYALNTNFPVVKVLNKSGYYVEPTAENVAVGLLKAKIDNNRSSSSYLTQLLDGVYDNPDRRAYPLSSYSYMVIPTAAEGSFNTAKGKTLGDFSYYFLCEGQQQAKVLGYSPLPINLVKAGLSQVRRIPGVDVQNVDISKCNNPTFSASGENLLAKNAPYPPSCDRQGSTQCSTGTGGAQTPTNNTGGGGVDPTDDSGGAPGVPDDPGGGTTSTTSGGPDGSGGGGDGAGGGERQSDDPGAVTVDPDTGQAVTTGTTTSDMTVAATTQNLSSSYSAGRNTAIMAIAALMLLLVVVAPPLVAHLLGARKRQ